MSDAGDGDGSPSGVVGWLRWFWTTEDSPVVYVRDVVTSVGAVLLVGLILFAVSGIWPPMVAIESGSMEPNMERGDLVFVMSDERFVPDAAPTYQGESTGVVPADRAAEVGHTEFNRPGDVIVFRRNGLSRATPVIHRAMLWVEDGENWYDRADPDAIGPAEDCEALRNCPAPHAGFITKGDNEVTNARYDQVSGLSEPVRPDWIIGTAEFSIPYLGEIRLLLSQSLTRSSVDGSTTVGSPANNHHGPTAGAASAGPTTPTATSPTPTATGAPA